MDNITKPAPDAHGFGLIEVMISLLLFTIFSVLVIYVLSNSGVQTITNSQITRIQHAGFSLVNALDTAADAQDWNGATLSGTGETGIPSADATQYAQTLSNIENDLSLSGENSRIQLSVVPNVGTTCPCQVQETFQWEGISWVHTLQIRY